MLSLVLILVLAALALLITALITASSLWAWLSIGASALAAVALLVDWLRRRAQARKAVRAGEMSDATEAGEDGEAAKVAEDVEGSEDVEDSEDTAGTEATDTSEVAATADTAATTDTTATSDTLDRAAEEPDDADQLPEPEPAVPAGRAAVRHDPHTPPGEEDTDAADLLVVSELDDQVLVIDEQPRYHQAECGWLLDKDTIPIAVSEARELGFTPCARCGPDAALVTRARKKQKRSAGKFGRE